MTIPAEFEDVDPAPGAEGETEGGTGSASYPGILRGGSLMKVERAEADDVWLMVYEWPQDSGEFVGWQFDDRDQLESTFGPNWWEKVSVEVRSESYANDNVTVLTNADEIIGVDDNFTRLMQDTMREQALAAGITDPTVLGRIVGNQEWQRISGQAALGEWSEQRVTAELRGSDFWTQELYPGISEFYGRTNEPEQMWRDYQRRVEPTLRLLGYDRDDDGSFRSVIGEMINRKVDDTAFIQNAETFVRAEQSPEFRSALNVWAQQELGRTVTFDEWFDLLAGKGQEEVERVVELANMQFAADRASVEVSNQQLRNIANQLNLREDEAFAAFSNVERSLLAIGTENLSRYGINQADLIAASTGINPESGRSIEAVRRQAQVAAKEMGMIDDPEAQLFVGFTAGGTPERPGLSPLAPEGA